ncbi:MAG: helix-turn-helix transcriptional regulator [Candidatus Bathyarchaeota archaeon]|nr:MAG: helix-turn-helix transcriptional regulator [Candidatus Bathyarchaeota archaeon]
MSAEKRLNGHKICEALSRPLRANIFQELVRVYPRKLSVSELQERLSEARMTLWFHLDKLREAHLVELNGSGRGFRAAARALTIEFNGDGIKLRTEG